MWIVKDRRAEQAYEIVQKVQPVYVLSKSHYVATAAEGVYNTLKDKKMNMANVLCLYFVYKTELLKVPNHPIVRMESSSKSQKDWVPTGACTTRRSTPTTPRMMRTLTRRGDCILNVFGGSKPIFAAMVSKNHTTY